MTEVWKPVRNYEDCYEVSSIGRLRRSVNRFGNPSGRLLSPANALGYRRYTLCKDRETRTFAAHRLTWEAFNGPIPEGLVINHKNGVKDDNRLDNLEVVTVAENTRHGFRVLGRPPNKNPKPGSQNGRARLTEADIPLIRKRIAQGDDLLDIAGDYRVAHATIWQIAKGNTWRHVT